jgi:sporulation protein YlmC with PRC-barrel domain
MDDRGDPVSYLVLAEGTPVYTSDGAQLGRVKRVLAEEEIDVFDGIIVDTGDGDRFVDAPHTGDLFERAVVLPFSAEEAAGLPAPEPNPAALDADPDDTTPTTLGDRVRRAWDLISGKY